MQYYELTKNFNFVSLGKKKIFNFISKKNYLISSFKKRDLLFLVSSNKI